MIGRWLASLCRPFAPREPVLREAYDAVMLRRGMHAASSHRSPEPGRIHGPASCEVRSPTPTPTPTPTPAPAPAASASAELLQARARLDRLLAAARDATENVCDDVMAQQVDHAVGRFNEYGDDAGPTPAQAIIACLIAVGAQAVIEARLEAREEG